jgi:hypothetical protein
MSRVIRDDKRILAEMSDVKIAHEHIINRIIQYRTDLRRPGLENPL